MEAVVHRCRAEQRCAALNPDGSAITKKPNTLCHACINKLQEQLDQLPTIRDVLRLYLTHSGVSAQTKVAFSSEPAAPLNVSTLDLIDEIDDVIDRTEGMRIADLVRQPPMQFKLWRGRGWRMDYLDGVQRALEVGKVWKKADDIIGMSRPWQRRMAPCPKCDLPTLGNFAGSDTIQCSNCGGMMTRTEYERICVIKAE